MFISYCNQEWPFGMCGCFQFRIVRSPRPVLKIAEVRYGTWDYGGSPIKPLAVACLCGIGDDDWSPDFPMIGWCFWSILWYHLSKHLGPIVRLDFLPSTERVGTITIRSVRLWHVVVEYLHVIQQGWTGSWISEMWYDLLIFGCLGDVFGPFSGIN